MSSDDEKPKNVHRRGIRDSEYEPKSFLKSSDSSSSHRDIRGARSSSNSPGPSNQSQPGKTMSMATQPNTDIQLASIHSNQTSTHGLIQQIKDAHDVLRKEKWSYTNRHGQEIYVAERIGRVLESFEEFAKIVNVAIQHHPDIMALVWAGARFILMIMRNGIRFMDDLEAAIATTVEKMAACEYYAQIYHESLKVNLESAMTTELFDDGFDSALKELYTAVHAFLNKAMEYIDPGNSARKILQQLKPFSVTMQPLIQAIADKEQKVKEYADMATMERIEENSSKLQEIQRVMVNIRKHMEPLAKLDDISNVTKEVRDTIVEFQTQVVQALQHQQRGILSYTPLDVELQYLKDQYLAESKDTGVFEASLYVPTQGMNYPHAPEDEHFDLATRVQEFLAQDSPQKVCLIQGVTGSGKSTFNHYLTNELWDAYDKAAGDKKSTTPIPVFISLASVFEPNRHNQDLIGDFFRHWSYWSDDLILRARRQLRFVFILDGYDEIENRDRHFYISNRLADWNAKIVITSRPEYLGEGYQTAFIPPGRVQLLREYWIAPFSISAMREFINKYAKSRSKGITNTATSAMGGYDYLLQRPELRLLTRNPSLLKVVLTVDPRTITDGMNFKRGTLYQAFLTHWLEQGYKRLLRVQLPRNLRETFTTLRERDFTGKAKRFCLDFAVELYRHKVLQVEYDDDAPSVWDNFLTDSDSQKRLLRYSLPLIRIGQASYRFIHKSLRDFAIAQAICQDDKFHTSDALINEFHIVDDSGVIDFIVEEAEHNPALQQALLDCVNRSKGGVQFAQAASNAITILVRTGWRFNGSDLRGIRICRADISSGWFDGAQLQKADLREVRACGVWLRGADLTSARMDGVWFGEKPCFRLNLKEDEYIAAFTSSYSVDGELLIAVSVCKIRATAIEVQVWSVSSRQLLHTFKGEKDRKLAFAPDGLLLASACVGGAIKLYALHKSYQNLRIFKADFDVPTSLAFSVDGQLLALASVHKPVYLWSIESGTILHTFTIPNNSESVIRTIAFSPDGKLLAFGGSNSRVHVWSMEDYRHVHTFGDYTRGGGYNKVKSISFSPDSQVLASCSGANYFQLWSLSRRQLIDTWSDHHSKRIHEICYAPNGQIAILSTDNILRLWSVQGRKVLHKFDEVKCSIAFSPDGQLLAGHAADHSIRQWAISQQLGISLPNTGADTGRIDRVAFWPKDKVLISVSARGTDYQPNTTTSGRCGVSVRMWPLDTSPTTNYVDIKVPRTTIPVIELRALDAKGEPVSAMDQIPLALNSTFITGGFGSGYTLYWFEDKKPKYIYHTLKYRVECVAISPDGELLACAWWNSHNSSCPLKLIKRQTGELVHEYEGPRYSPRVMEFSHNGQLIASGDGKVVQCWSVPERRLLHTIEGYEGPRLLGGYNFNVAFSPDDQMVAFSEDLTLQLWSTSMPSFTHLNAFEGHTAPISSIVFSPDGDIMASGSLDRTLRFWSVRSMKYLFCIDTRREISALAWRTDPGSEDLAVGTEDSVLQLWRVRKKADYSPENPSVEVSCQWSSRIGLLNAPNLQIRGVTGLDVENLELLKQVGAVGEPVGAFGRIREIMEVEEGENDEPVGPVCESVGAVCESVGAVGEPVDAFGESVGTVGESVGAVGEPVGAFGESVGAFGRIREIMEVEEGENNFGPSKRSGYGETALHVAVREGRTERVKLLLEAGAGINVRNRNWNTALHIAVKSGHSSTVEVLLNSGATIDNPNQYGDTALLVAIAACSSQVDIVKLLINNGASVDATLEDGETTLHKAARIATIEVMNVLLNSSAPVNPATINPATKDGETPLHAAARCGRDGIVELLLKSGAPIDVTTKDGKTALHIAAKFSHTNVVHVLLKMGANIRATDDAGATALHVASINDSWDCSNSEVVDMLLNNSASIDATDQDGETALHIACRWSYSKVVTVLLQWGAKVDARNKNGQTPLHIASRYSQSLVIDMLLEAGARIDSIDNADGTVLHAAVWSAILSGPAFPVLGMLVKGGAPIDSVDANGTAALHIAAACGVTQVIKLLLESGGSVGITTQDGWTALHFAAWYGEVEAVELLLGHGSDVEEKNKDGNTAFDIARKLKHTTVLSLLVIAEE